METKELTCRIYAFMHDCEIGYEEWSSYELAENILNLYNSLLNNTNRVVETWLIEISRQIEYYSSDDAKNRINTFLTDETAVRYHIEEGCNILGELLGLIKNNQ